MVDILNDDCWLKILEYVKDVRDHLALCQVHPRLHYNVQFHWQHLKEAHVDEEALQRFQEQPEIMHDFLHSACGTLQKLVLKGGNMQVLETWKSYSFPNIISLKCTDMGDAQLLQLTQIFPGLQKLTLQSNEATGQHLWLFDQLDELHLMSCESLEACNLQQIFGKLSLRKISLLYYGYCVNLNEEGVLAASKCSTLEELTIDDHHLLGSFLPNLLVLPRLRRLAFYTRDYYETLLLTVANIQPHKVQSLLFNDAFWSSCRLRNVLPRLHNMCRLALQDDDIEAQDLYHLCKNLHHLEELHLMQMRSLPTPTQLWNMVAVCKPLKVLDLSSNQLESTQFLELSAACLERVLNNRSSPLTLHLHNTGLEKNTQQTLAALEHRNLSISFKPVNLNIWSSRFIEVEFNQDFV